MHLVSINSKRCGIITYCYTLLRPAFCPFCLGDNRPTTPATERWKSWTREHQLQNHLQSHLEEVSWPIGCPHPLCSASLFNDELSFWFHLQDVHDLKVPNRLLEPRYAGDVNQKRKMPDGDDQPRLLNERSSYYTPSQPPDSSPDDGNALDMSHITLTPTPAPALFDSITDSLAIDDIPNLTRSENTSSLNSGEPSVVDCMEELFSSYLRSRSPSPLPGRAEDNKAIARNSNAEAFSNTAYRFSLSSPTDTVENPILPVQKKPRLILRVRPPETETGLQDLRSRNGTSAKRKSQGRRVQTSMKLKKTRKQRPTKCSSRVSDSALP